MWRISARALLALIFALSFFLLSLEAFADQTIKLAPGANVEIQGNSAIINNGGGGGAGEVGTWDCNCVGSGAKGSCTLTKTGNGIMCMKSGAATCTGSCNLTTTTGGISPGIAAPKSKSGLSAPSAPSQSK